MLTLSGAPIPRTTSHSVWPSATAPVPALAAAAPSEVDACTTYGPAMDKSGSERGVSHTGARKREEMRLGGSGEVGPPTPEYEKLMKRMNAYPRAKSPRRFRFFALLALLAAIAFILFMLYRVGVR